jgi:hypothetical protein
MSEPSGTYDLGGGRRDGVSNQGGQSGSNSKMPDASETEGTYDLGGSRRGGISGPGSGNG